jgi:acyl-CoA synthetase (AMP-forming)/AMP-acid ligase II
MTTPQTIAALFSHQATSQPGRVAMITPEGDATYGEILDRSSEYAGHLVRMGARKGTVLGLLLPNGLDWVSWWVASARIGAIAVPMNTFAPPAEVQLILERSGAHILVAVPGFARHAYRDDLSDVIGDALPCADRVEAQLPQLRRVIWTDETDSVAADPAVTRLLEGLAADVCPADPLTIIYTSGSTGDPKGTVHTQGGVVRQAQRLARLTSTSSSTVLWTSMPLNWVGGLMWSFLRIIAAGGTFVTQERFEASAALKLFTTAKVDTVTGWGPVIEQLTTHPDFSTEAHGRITGLAPLDPTEHGQPSLLGMTETLGPHSGWMRDEDGPYPAESVGSSGRALEGIEHRVVDPATRIDVPAEQVGELLVRGDSVMHGLHRRERSEVFTPDGWYPTRDAVALSDGWLFFHGRLDDLIKTSGANVSPAEVKAVLESSEAVRQAFVVGVPHPSRGADVVAFIVAEEPDLDVTSLLDEARRQLAAYKVPRRILVVDEDVLPWLSSQKIDTRRLRELAATM